jgi:hypothetical protein
MGSRSTLALTKAPVCRIAEPAPLATGTPDESSPSMAMSARPLRADGTLMENCVGKLMGVLRATSGSSKVSLLSRLKTTARSCTISVAPDLLSTVTTTPCSTTWPLHAQSARAIATADLPAGDIAGRDYTPMPAGHGGQTGKQVALAAVALPTAAQATAVSSLRPSRVGSCFVG